MCFCYVCQFTQEAILQCERVTTFSARKSECSPMFNLTNRILRFKRAVLESCWALVHNIEWILGIRLFECCDCFVVARLHFTGEVQLLDIPAELRNSCLHSTRRASRANCTCFCRCLVFHCSVPHSEFSRRSFIVRA